MEQCEYQMSVLPLLPPLPPPEGVNQLLTERTGSPALVKLASGSAGETEAQVY